MIVFGLIASAFGTLLICSGKAEFDHSQLLVAPATQTPTEMMKLDRDRIFMKSLSLDESVFLGEKCPSSSASSEKEARERLSAFSLR